MHCTAKHCYAVLRHHHRAGGCWYLVTPNQYFIPMKKQRHKKPSRANKSNPHSSAATATAASHGNVHDIRDQNH